MLVLAVRTMLVCSNYLKPSCSTVTAYGAASRSGTTKSPPPTRVLVVKVAWVSLFLTVTVAPTIGAPWASTREPAIEPAVVCASVLSV